MNFKRKPMLKMDTRRQIFLSLGLISHLNFIQYLIINSFKIYVGIFSAMDKAFLRLRYITLVINFKCIISRNIPAQFSITIYVNCI